MKAYKELFWHAKNEEKKQELIACFQKVWTQAEIFGRLKGGNLKWNLTSHRDFLPAELGAWNSSPICINRLSPSPYLEAEFLARPDLSDLIDNFIQGVSNNCNTQEDTHLSNGAPSFQDTNLQLVKGAANAVAGSNAEPDPAWQTHHQSTPSTPPISRTRISLTSLQSGDRITHSSKRKADERNGKENLFTRDLAHTEGSQQGGKGQQVKSSEEKVL